MGALATWGKFDGRSVAVRSVDAMDHNDDGREPVHNSSIDAQRYAYLANHLVELLEIAKHALDHDREVVKASLVAVSSS